MASKKLHENGILGAYIHYSDGEGNLIQGTIMAVRVEDSEVKATVACRDNRYRDVWLANVTIGAPPTKREPQGGA